MKILRFPLILLAAFTMLLSSCGSEDPDDPIVMDPVKVSISGLSVDEGNGYSNISVQLKLDAAAEQQITATISTNDGTAEANKDYISVANQAVVFAVGETEKTYEITLVGDVIFEEDEYFEVKIVSVTGPATIDVATARVDLVNDDAMVAQEVTVDLTVDWAALANLAPGSEVPYEIMNFGQPSSVPNAEYTTVAAVSDSITFTSKLSPAGDTILYMDLIFDPVFSYEDYLSYYGWVTVGDSVSVEIFVDIFNADITDVEGKYDLKFMVGTAQGRLGPFIIDPKIRIPGQ